MSVAEGPKENQGPDSQKTGITRIIEVDGHNLTFSNLSIERRYKALWGNEDKQMYRSEPLPDGATDYYMADQLGHAFNGYFTFTQVSGTVALEGGEALDDHSSSPSFRFYTDVTPIVFFSGDPRPIDRYLRNPDWAEQARALRREGYERVIIPTPSRSIHFGGNKFMYGFGPDNKIVLPNTAPPLLR